MPTALESTFFFLSGSFRPVKKKGLMVRRMTNMCLYSNMSYTLVSYVLYGYLLVVFFAHCMNSDMNTEKSLPSPSKPLSFDKSHVLMLHGQQRTYQVTKVRIEWLKHQYKLFEHTFTRWIYILLVFEVSNPGMPVQSHSMLRISFQDFAEWAMKQNLDSYLLKFIWFGWLHFGSPWSSWSFIDQWKSEKSVLFKVTSKQKRSI